MNNNIPWWKDTAYGFANDFINKNTHGTLDKINKIVPKPKSKEEPRKEIIHLNDKGFVGAEQGNPYPNAINKEQYDALANKPNFFDKLGVIGAALRSEPINPPNTSGGISHASTNANGDLTSAITNDTKLKNDNTYYDKLYAAFKAYR